MTIQFNTDNKVTVSEEFRIPLISLISEGLRRFSHQITRIEVHLSDDNGDKEGSNDKRCMIEARLAGMKPIAVTSHAGNHEKAVQGAVDKLKSSLDSYLGRLSAARRFAFSIPGSPPLHGNPRHFIPDKYVNYVNFYMNFVTFF